MEVFSELIFDCDKKLIVGLYRNWENRSGSYTVKFCIHLKRS